MAKQRYINSKKVKGICTDSFGIKWIDVLKGAGITETKPIKYRIENKRNASCDALMTG